MMLESAVDGRRRILCDELGLDVRDVVRDWRLVESIDFLGSLVWVPCSDPRRVGWVCRSDELEPFSPGWFDAVRRAFAWCGGLDSPVSRRMPRAVFAGLGGFAGCSLRGNEGSLG